MKHEFCVYTRIALDQKDNFCSFSTVFRRDTMETWNGQKDQMITPLFEERTRITSGNVSDTLERQHDRTVGDLIRCITEG